MEPEVLVTVAQQTGNGLGYVQRTGGIRVEDVILLAAIRTAQMDGGHADLALPLRLQHRDLQIQRLTVVGDTGGAARALSDLIGIDAHAGELRQGQREAAGRTGRRGGALTEGDVKGAGRKDRHIRRSGDSGVRHAVRRDGEAERLGGTDGPVVHQLIELGDGHLGDVLVGLAVHCDAGSRGRLSLHSKGCGGQSQRQKQRQEQGKAFFHT